MGKRIYLNGLFGFAAAFAAGIAGVSAADMETKSGRYFEEYSIFKQNNDLTVSILHMAGVAKVPLTDLPDEIAAPYIQKAIADRIAKAEQETDPQKKVQLLQPVITQFPNACKDIRKTFAVFQRESKIENNIVEAIRGGWPEDSIQQLQSLRKLHDDFPYAVRRIDQQIEEEKKKQKTLAEKIDREIESAVKQEDPAVGYRQLKMLAEQYPKYPCGDRQQEYMQKIARHLGAFAQQSEQNRQQQAVAQAMQKAQELRNQIQYASAIAIVEDVLKKEPSAPNIRKAQALLSVLQQEKRVIDAIQQAKQVRTYEEAFQILRNIIRDEASSANIGIAKEMLKQYESMYVLQNLTVNATQQLPQISIRKNEDRRCFDTMLVVFPWSSRKEAQQLYQKTASLINYRLLIKKDMAQLDRVSQEGNILEWRGSMKERAENLSQHGRLLVQIKQYIENYKSAYGDVAVRFNSHHLLLHDNTSQQLAEAGVRVEKFQSAQITLSNIQAPIILFVYEKIFVDEDWLFQGWYWEYTPSAETKIWTVR